MWVYDQLIIDNLRAKSKNAFQLHFGDPRGISEWVERSFFIHEVAYSLDDLIKGSRIDFSWQIHVYQMEGELPFCTAFFEMETTGQLLQGVTPPKTVADEFTYKQQDSRIKYCYKRESTDDPIADLTVFLKKVKAIFDDPAFLEFFKAIHSQISPPPEVKCDLSISANYVRSLVPSITFDKGMDYYWNGNVLDYRICKDCLIGKVQGHNAYPYDTQVTIRAGRIVSHSCTCFAHAQYSGPCKHIIALVFTAGITF